MKNLFKPLLKHTLLFFTFTFPLFASAQSVVVGLDSLKQAPGKEGQRKINGVLISWQSGRLTDPTACSLKPCDYVADGMSHKASCPSYSITVKIKNTNKYKVSYSVNNFEAEGTYRDNTKGEYKPVDAANGTGTGSFSGILKRKEEFTYTYNECAFAVPKVSGLPHPATPRYASYQLQVDKYKKKSKGQK